MLKEIGSNFWLNTRRESGSQSDETVRLADCGIVGRDTVLLSTGRAAISFALKDIKSRRARNNLCALIPPYTCETVVQPFLDEDIKVFAYDIDEKLLVKSDRFEQMLKTLQPDVVLLHRYFGFDTAVGIQEIIKDYRSRGTVFIEDRTQDIFSSFSTLSVDYVVGSFRKWGPIPDGGYCVSADHALDDAIKPEREDRTLVSSKLHAFQLKHDYMIENIGRKNEYLRAYEEAERILDAEDRFFHMSKTSITILNQMDLDGLTCRRRQNYRYVYENLCDSKQLTILTGELTDGVVPLYIAVKCAKRDDLQLLLREQNIYAPIVWPKPQNIPDISKIVDEIYDHVLCLPIDQRYGLDDMARMIGVIRSFEE